VLLNSWKEIAAYLKCGVRTAQRWQRDLHMPVMRVREGKRGPVMANSEASDKWIEHRASDLDSHRYTSTFETLARTSTERGLHFLDTELSTGRRFAKLARGSKNDRVAARRRKAARMAYDSIQRHLAFAEALPKAQLNKFNAELTEFKSELQKLGEQV